MNTFRAVVEAHLEMSDVSVKAPTQLASVSLPQTLAPTDTEDIDLEELLAYCDSTIDKYKVISARVLLCLNHTIISDYFDPHSLELKMDYLNSVANHNSEWSSILKLASKGLSEELLSSAFKTLHAHFVARMHISADLENHFTSKAVAALAKIPPPLRFT